MNNGRCFAVGEYVFRIGWVQGIVLAPYRRVS